MHSSDPKKPVPRRVKIKTILPGLALCLTLASCQGSDQNISTLWTNIPGILTFVDHFNASQKEWQLIVDYRDDPGRALRTGPEPDLVIAKDLASSERKDQMSDLGFLFNSGSVSTDNLYRRILTSGEQGGQVRLLPLSFDLPVVIFSRSALPDLPGFSLSPEELRDLNAKFNAGIKEDGRRLAFSPLWGNAGLQWLSIQGAAFHESFSGELEWNSQSLNAAAKWLSEWPSPGRDAVKKFQKKYLISDVTSFLDSGRIQFYPSTLAEFLSRPWDERKTLDFRYIENKGQLMATDDVVWAGIPNRGSRLGAARAFLRWFSQAQVQAQVAHEAHAENPRLFGIAQGLSARADVNPLFAQDYLDLKGRLPAKDQLRFWNPLPPQWRTLKSAVLFPWITAKAPDGVSLKAALVKLRSQNSLRSVSGQP